MSTDEDQDARLNGITESIIGAAFKVHNGLGIGFLEKVYENALAYELRQQGVQVSQQQSCDVEYDGHVVGDYIADIVVEGSVLVELKAVSRLHDAHTAQCLNYLAATKLQLCLLLNFGSRVEVKRLRL